MPIPSYGALPLSQTWLLIRGLSLIAMLAIVGLSAHFVSEIVSSNLDAPKAVVGTLSVTSLATLYCLVSIAFFWAQASLGLFIMTGIDALLLLAFTVVSIVLGKPLSFLNCMAVADVSAAADAAGADAFTQSLASDLGKSGAELGLGAGAGSTRMTCFEAKAIWGLCIALCIMFSCSCIILPTLWFKNKKAGRQHQLAKSFA